MLDELQGCSLWQAGGCCMHAQVGPARVCVQEGCWYAHKPGSHIGGSVKMLQPSQGWCVHTHPHHHNHTHAATALLHACPAAMAP